MTDIGHEPSLEPQEKQDLYYQDNQYFCWQCGKEIAEEQSKFNLCVACEADTAAVFRMIMNTFSKHERAYLNWKYEGEAF